METLLRQQVYPHLTCEEAVFAFSLECQRKFAAKSISYAAIFDVQCINCSPARSQLCDVLFHDFHVIGITLHCSIRRKPLFWWCQITTWLSCKCCVSFSRKLRSCICHANSLKTPAAARMDLCEPKRMLNAWLISWRLTTCRAALTRGSRAASLYSSSQDRAISCSQKGSRREFLACWEASSQGWQPGLSSTLEKTWARCHGLFNHRRMKYLLWWLLNAVA